MYSTAVAPVVVGGVIATSNQVMLQLIQTPLRLSLICSVRVTFTLDEETSIVDGEKLALRSVGGSVSGEESVTVRSVGNPRVTRLLAARRLELPAESHRYTRAFQTPAATNRGTVTVVRYVPFNVVPNVREKYPITYWLFGPRNST